MAGFDEVDVVAGRQFPMLLAHADEQLASGMSGWSQEDLAGIDGMLYVLPFPQVYNPSVSEGFFSFPGYSFNPDIYFFDAEGWLINGVRGAACSADGSWSSRCGKAAGLGQEVAHGGDFRVWRQLLAQFAQQAGQQRTRFQRVGELANSAGRTLSPRRVG